MAYLSTNDSADIATNNKKGKLYKPLLPTIMYTAEKM